MEKYRYNLSKDLLSYIKINFIKRPEVNNHEYFDELWKEWIKTERVKILFKIEEQKLKDEGSSGNIYEKIFKSIRYYYLNKDDEKKSTKKKRRKYIHIDEGLSDVMNKFIKKTSIVKPAKAYNKFILNNKDLYNSECVRLKEHIENEEALLKIKKTFKNKFYLKDKK